MNQAKDLLEKYKRGHCTAEELALLQQWFHQLNQEEPTALTDADLQAGLQRFEQAFAASKTKVRPMRNWYWPAAASAAALLIAVGSWLYFSDALKQEDQLKEELVQQPRVEQEVELPLTTLENKVPLKKPAENIALLEFADGDKMSLDGLSTGSAVERNGVIITKLGSGEVTIAVKKEAAAAGLAQQEHQISTPRGGMYNLTLPDGSKVFLNAASRLRFPRQFAKQDRRVELQGEAYFEIAKDQARPFYVLSQHGKLQQEIRVYGTKFVVSAYRDDQVFATTLLEGKISIKGARGGQESFMLPNQQALNTVGDLQIAQADVEAAMAWRNQLFDFSNSNLEQVMKQISRWYDIDIAMAEQLKALPLSGQLSRNKPLPELLEILASTYNLKFNFKQQKLQVSQ
ncbi:FecR family protein [Sphingobacterium humi]|uniref:DUF4974 domain-containing protein n=1 Tax=Sphingobacterium humi TaxID=1796905 RepID=A0A6N8KXU0_9SPHI|nr:FecR domain-containing protein [Sphingobacterium humi]MVZ61061.1 DUF4974 domain-containing protein [Sphingobacterium humi]